MSPDKVKLVTSALWIHLRFLGQTDHQRTGEMAEGRDKPFSFFDGEEVAELAEGLSRTLNISYNVYVKEQNTT